ncbi:MAG TPA: hypothetical protein VG168_15175 [Bryobacteraceae bacterium]|jgi:hypothetical protein|nr:hypothetical protein [Bryobacteraceae bacterium]
MKRLLLAACAIVLPLLGEQGWWMREPIRWVQTNLRETDADLDAEHLVAQLTAMRANVLLMGMGGIVAYYPTKAPFHYPSPFLPPGRDMFGDVLKAAHQHGIRVVGRFDFSKTSQKVFAAHPEWFFRRANGEPVVYNGLYSTCINGGYYRSAAMAILAESLDKYDVDGLFFNMFGNQSRDYSGNDVGLCHCDSCKRKYWEMFHEPIPDQPDDHYRKFMFICSREVAAAIGHEIRSRRPNAGYFNYIQESTDGIMSESNTAVARPLPLWPYSASDNVNRARNSEPSKMSVNLDMQFVDYPWRFATVPQNEIALRIWENVANGGAATFEVNGTLDQQDRQALDTAVPIFRWLAENQQYYSGEQSAARVLLLGTAQQMGRTYNQNSYRGLFRLLSEEHIPFAVSDNLDWLKEHKIDLVIASDWAPPELSKYAEGGGRVLVVSSRPPEFPVAPVIKTWPDMKGYIRVRDHAAFPSLNQTDLLMTDGPFTEVQIEKMAPLTLVPPSMIGPPEFVHIDQKDTAEPGLVVKRIGAGSVTWIPWNLGALYYRLSLPAHAGVFHDVVERLYPQRLLSTDAHRLVEMTLMNLGSQKLVHLINLSGQSQTGYFDPVSMTNIHLKVKGTFHKAFTVRHVAKLSVHVSAGYTEMTVPRLEDYELVILE